MEIWNRWDGHWKFHKKIYKNTTTKKNKVSYMFEKSLGFNSGLGLEFDGAGPTQAFGWFLNVKKTIIFYSNCMVYAMKTQATEVGPTNLWWLWNTLDRCTCLFWYEHLFFNFGLSVTIPSGLDGCKMLEFTNSWYSLLVPGCYSIALLSYISVRVVREYKKPKALEEAEAWKFWLVVGV